MGKLKGNELKKLNRELMDIFDKHAKRAQGNWWTSKFMNHPIILKQFKKDSYYDVNMKPKEFSGVAFKFKHGEDKVTIRNVDEFLNSLDHSILACQVTIDKLKETRELIMKHRQDIIEINMLEDL